MKTLSSLDAMELSNNDLEKQIFEDGSTYTGAYVLFRARAAAQGVRLAELTPGYSRLELRDHYLRLYWTVVRGKGKYPSIGVPQESSPSNFHVEAE